MESKRFLDATSIALFTYIMVKSLQEQQYVLSAISGILLVLTMIHVSLKEV